MTPIEKALELINKFEPFADYESDDCFTSREKMFINAKQCALIAVDELIDEQTSWQNGQVNPVLYWQEVKQEIEKL